MKLMMNLDTKCEIIFVILTCAYVNVLMNEFLAGILLFLPSIYVVRQCRDCPKPKMIKLKCNVYMLNLFRKDSYFSLTSYQDGK